MRSVKRRASAFVVATAAVVAVGPAANAGSTEEASAGPVGKWNVTVQVDGQTFTSLIHFTPTWKGFQLKSGGAGTWVPGGGNRFSFHMVEPIHDPATGTLYGWLDVHQSGTFTANSWSTTGYTKQYDANDVLRRTVPVSDSGTRP